MSDGMVLFTFTVLTNNEKSFEQQAAFDLLSSAQLEF